MTIKNISPSETVKEESMKAYPAKVARKRAKQIVVNTVAPDGTVPDIQANARTIPGIITQRGCTYAGCKGVVLGPTRDIVNIVHGPIGCSFYAWLTRRNQTRPDPTTDRQLHDLLLLHRHAGRGHHLRRREKTANGHPGGLSTCSIPRPSASSPPARWASSATTSTRWPGK